MAALLLGAKKVLRTPGGLALGAGSLIAVLLLVAAMLGGGTNVASHAPAFRLASEAELTALSPMELAGLGRQHIKVETADGMTVPAIALDATYKAGARRIDLKIVNSPDLDQVVGFGGEDTASYDRTSKDGYQKRWREADAIFVESVDRASGAATFGRVQRNFYVMARGQGGPSIAELRTAVGQVGGGTLPAPSSGG